MTGAALTPAGRNAVARGHPLGGNRLAGETGAGGGAGDDGSDPAQRRRKITTGISRSVRVWYSS